MIHDSADGILMCRTVVASSNWSCSCSVADTRRPCRATESATTPSQGGSFGFERSRTHYTVPIFFFLVEELVGFVLRPKSRRLSSDHRSFVSKKTHLSRYECPLCETAASAMAPRQNTAAKGHAHIARELRFHLPRSGRVVVGGGGFHHPRWKKTETAHSWSGCGGPLSSLALVSDSGDAGRWVLDLRL